MKGATVNIRNQSIEGLRGFLIILIVLFHYLYVFSKYYPENAIINIKSADLTPLAQIGISGFFLISGFYLRNVIVSSNGSLLQFLSKRLRKLYPTFAIICVVIFCVLFFYPLEGRESHFNILLKNLLLIPVFSNEQLLDGAHWFLFALLQLYIISCLFFVSWKNRNFLVMLLVIGFISSLYLNHALIIRYYYLLSFVAGIGISIFHARNPRLILILYISLGVGISLLLHNIGILVLYILFYILRNSSNNVLNKFFSLKFLTFIGNYSYSWYLLHQNIGFVIILSLLLLGLPGLLAFLCAVIVTFGLSIFIQKIILPPSEKILLAFSNNLTRRISLMAQRTKE